jgi:hypothetical protein
MRRIRLETMKAKASAEAPQRVEPAPAPVE